MKKLLFALVLFISVYVNAQWNWYNPKPMGEMIYEIEVINDYIAYAGGSMGHVVKTVNSGDSWYSLGSIYSNHIASLSFLGSEIGWAFINEGKILKTTDGGISWSIITDDVNGEDFMRGEFLSESIGYVACRSGKIYRTNDGGGSWQEVSSNNYKIYDMFFYSNSLGFAVCDEGIILRTIDGGLNWTSYNTFDNNYFVSVCFVNENVGYVCGFQSFYKTVNGGESWFKKDVSDDEFAEYVFHGCSFSDENTGFLTTFDGKVMRTTDGGTNWEDVSPDPFPSYLNIDISESGIIYLTNDLGQIYKSTNNGDTWTLSTEAYTNKHIYGVDFISQDEGIVVGHDGVLMKTTEGGCSWEMIDIDEQYSLTDVLYLSEEKIIVSSSLGTVFISEDSGDTWTMYDLPTEINTARMEFVNDTLGWIVGFDGDGAVCKTIDGGYTWEFQNTSFEASLYDLTFTSDTTGFIAAPSGKILNTIDGGENWSAIDVGNENNTWYSIDNVGYDTIYACGNYGKIASSYDAGLTWEIVTLNGSTWFNFIDIYDDGVGYIVGVSYVYKTVDFGRSWDIIPRFSNQWLTCFKRVSANQVFIVGYNGTILSNVIDPLNSNSVDEQDILTSSLCPNPVSDVLMINDDVASYIIYDLNGKRIANVSLKNQVDVSDYENGIYVIKYHTRDGKICVEKFIVAK